MGWQWRKRRVGCCVALVAVTLLLGLIDCAFVDDGEWESSTVRAVEREEENTFMLNQMKKHQDWLGTVADELRDQYSNNNSNDTATTYLAALYLLGGIDVEIDNEMAFRYAQEAAQKGNPMAHALLGFMYATGRGVTEDQTMAVLHYSFAAQGDDPIGLMALGYRHMYRRNLPPMCSTYVHMFRKLSTQVVYGIEMEDALVLPQSKYTRLSEELDWGDSDLTSERDIINYYSFLADTGEVEALVTLGNLFMEGGYGLDRDYEKAYRLFREAADLGDPGGLQGLGRLHEEGLGRPKNLSLAIQLYQMAASGGDPSALNRLGMLHLKGLVTPSGSPISESLTDLTAIQVQQNRQKGVEYLQRAAESGSPHAMVHMGNLIEEGILVDEDTNKAVSYYAAAMTAGLPTALQALADVYVSSPGACSLAAILYKKVAQTGIWGDAILWDAEDFSLEGENYFDRALARYELAAEMGYEVAQSNAAWIYEHRYHDYTKALRYLLMSAEQHTSTGQPENVLRVGGASFHGDSLVRIGDYYYYGKGVNESHQTASTWYKAAAEAGNPEALFYVGWMHHFGVGLPKDLPLAKRYYDLSLVGTPSLTPVILPAILAVLIQLESSGILENIQQAILEHDNALLLFLFGLLALLFMLRKYLLQRQRQRAHHQPQPPPQIHQQEAPHHL
ncbi:Sel1l protein [Pelomyxa schiedti]|nr:Sel1l protein [Pelomyxa schiedti]